ncbi:hypothetical protein V5O48_015576 [Marasmius crinis-equi]|uniref:F-box domain-containing protein n=1 Tax=Marasmius crinis-equi TaxID=585013 RepID=A0ABR3EU64_9AGAR
MYHPLSSLCIKCQQETVISLTSQPLRTIEAHTLRTNYIPSDVEASQILAIVEEEQREMDGLEEEAILLQCLLDRLETRKQALQANMARRRSSVSALRRFPTEIWGIIFEMVCSSENFSLSLDLRPYRKHKISMLPVTLSHVCSRWRAIIPNSSRLWSSINIHFRSLARRDTTLIETYLENSRGSPLTLRIERFIEGSSPSEWDGVVWKMLAKHFSRVERLLLSGDYIDMLEIPLASDISFPILKTFRGGPSENFHGALPWWQALHSATPLLRTATLNIIHPRATLPYHQLTTLILEDTHPGDLSDLTRILPDCLELEYLQIECVGPGWEGDNDFTPFEARSVRTLIVSESYKLDTDSPMLMQFLEVLTMPSLETFQLDCADHSRDAGWPESLLGMLGRCAGSLRNLSVHLWREGPLPIANDNRPLADLLRPLPKLTSFEFGMGWYTDSKEGRQQGGDHNFNTRLLQQLFVELGRSDRAQDLAPNLTKITILLSDITFDHPGLMNTILRTAALRSPFVASERWQALTNIRLIRMPGHTLTWPIGGNSYLVDLKGDVGKRIESLQREGAHVLIEELR